MRTKRPWFAGDVAKMLFLLRDIVQWPRLSSELKKTRQLKNRHVNENAFVFLTGRSVNDFSLGDFSGKVTFGCNEIARHPDFEKMSLKYYADIEPFTVIDNLSNLKVLYRRMLLELDEKTSGRRPICFFNYTAKRFIEQSALLEGFQKYYCVHRRIFKEEPRTIYFDRPNPLMNGVVYFLLSMAIYMGFKTVYLIGAGYTYEPFQWHHFYDPYDREDLVAAARAHSDVKPNPLHSVIRMLAEESSVEIRNVCPTGYTSPIYEEIGVMDFKKKFNLS